MSRHERHMRKAIQVAKTSGYRWKLGAVLTKGSRILSYAPNKFRNPPALDHENATLHAEVAALRGSLLRRPVAQSM